MQILPGSTDYAFLAGLAAADIEGARGLLMAIDESEGVELSIEG
jgi:hypothetical protein